MKRFVHFRSSSLSFMAVGAFLALQLTTDAADISGAIFYEGTPPPEIPITPLKNDPVCGTLYAKMPTTHFYKVGPHRGLGDVVVSLTGLHRTSMGAEAAPLVIDQKGCQYTPYISACQTGQTIIVRNSDPVLHNVHVIPQNPKNQEVNRAQVPGGPDIKLTLNAPEPFVLFKCDVHPWMFAFVSVFDHPYFSVSGEDGHYRIHNVPPGSYTIVARHRKAGTLQQNVVVRDQDVKLDFTFKAMGSVADPDMRVGLTRRPP